MAIFDVAPKRKSKPKINPWDSQPDFMALKAAITSGRMKPMEQKAMYIDPAKMGPRLGLKDPVRAAADSMRRFIRKMNLDADYWSEKFETQTPGLYALVVTYEPAALAHKKTAK